MSEQIQQYFDLMKDIEGKFLSYIEESNQESFINFLNEQQIIENKQKFKSFLYILVHISNNYHRIKDFYDKIDQVLINYKLSIQTFFKNYEIFHIFQSNKRILLFLIQQKLFTIDQEIIDFFNQKKFIQESYIEYFYHEVEMYLPESVKNECKNKVKELNENNLELFNEKRKIGENDSYISTLIRNDEVVDFITYLEKANISPSSVVNMSIYETNHTLLKKNKKLTLIEYAAYFGSQQIFLYLFRRNVKIESNIWSYVVHGKNADMIHFLEENHIPTFKNSYQYLVIKAIKYHHNEIADYFRLNFCQKEQIYDQYLLRKYLKYYNFHLEDYNVKQIIQFSIESDLFYYFCKYDYYIVVEILSSINGMNINQQYKIYKPIPNQKDIILSLIIKNGEIKKLPEPEKIGFDRKCDEKLIDLVYRKEGSNYYTYNYDLDIMTALLIATRKGNLDIVQLLLDSKDININFQSKKYYKSLYRSFKRFNRSRNDFFTIQEKRSLIHEAIESGYVDVVQHLSSFNKVDFDCELIKLSIFIDSCTTANTKLKNEYHKSLLELAAELGYTEIMKFLVSKKNININQKSLEVNYKAGGCECYSINVKRTEKMPLHIAIQKGNFNIVKFCLEQPKIDVNVPYNVFELDGWNHNEMNFFFNDKSGKIILKISTLYLAVSNCNIDIIHLLLNQSKIDINMKSTLEKENYNDLIPERTALHLAVINKQIDIIELLLKQKQIDVNVLDENNKKPIDYADDQKIKKLFNLL